MKYLKMSFLLMLFFITNSLAAQNETSIIGKWHNEDKEGITECYFFEHQNNVYGLIYYFKDDQEEFSLLEELKKDYSIEKLEDLTPEVILQHLREFVWFQEFKKNGEEWSGKFTYTEKGETSTYTSALKSISKDSLQVRVKYWGIWDSSIWKRVS